MTVYERLETTYAGKDLELCEKAYDFAKKAHENQKRASGEDYFVHPCTVAGILLDLGLDAATVAAAFLHDVLEDTPVSEGDLKKEFGEEVLELVQGVTKLEKIEFTSREEEQAENFRKLFVAMAKDIRVIIIKLADRLHNMRSLNFLSVERQQRMARETLEIYAPLAGRLGISQIKCELEDLCLKYLEPDSYEYISTNVEERLKEGGGFVDHVIEDVKAMLEESHIKGEVFGRRKHLYSIYRKMMAVLADVAEILRPCCRPYTESKLAYEVFGCDFLVTTDLNVVLLEINQRIGFYCIPTDPDPTRYARFTRDYYAFVFNNAIMPLLEPELPPLPADEVGAPQFPQNGCDQQQTTEKVQSPAADSAPQQLQTSEEQDKAPATTTRSTNKDETNKKELAKE